MSTFENLGKHEKSRKIACGAEYHTHAIEKALNLFYWTGSRFHYDDAIAQFKNLIYEMEKLQNTFKKEV